MARLSEILAPKERAFFSLLEAAAANALHAADLLDEMLHSYPERRELARELLICEQEGDRITQELFRHLNETFVTPFEADDARNLALALDDVVDLAEEAADHLVLYKVDAARHDARRLAQIRSRRLGRSTRRCRGFAG